MSATLKAIMEHWDGELPGGEGQSVLPFNLEVFCRKNDALVDDLTKKLSDMTDDRDHWYEQARSLSQILAKDFLYRAEAALPPQEPTT